MKKGVITCDENILFFQILGNNFKNFFKRLIKFDIFFRNRIRSSYLEY